jgi:mannose-6-phosphate isomerase
MEPLPPLPMSPILLEKVWGGRRLERYGKDLPPGANVGESWEIADLDRTSVSGGGGGAAQSTVRSGAHAGRTLRSLMDAHGEALMGDLERTASGGFPLLLKLLDARTNLSVQIHPSPAYAAAHPEAHLKTESWLVLEATPAASLYAGLKEGVTAEDLRVGIERQEVAPLLEEIPATPGMCYTLPSGLIHALGAGVLVAEVQTPSDTTFRLFDWGRSGREMHPEEAMACLEMERQRPPSGMLGEGSRRRVVAETEAYRAAIVSLQRGERIVIEESARPRVALITEGEATLRDDAGEAEEIALGPGATALLPASCAGWRLIAGNAGVTLLETTFPSSG